MRFPIFALFYFFISLNNALGIPTTTAYPPYLMCSYGFDFLNANTCYKFVGGSQSYSDASATCTSYGANLVSVHNAIDNHYLPNLMNVYDIDYMWLGLGCFNTTYPRNCAWDDGSATDYSNFAPGNPDLTNGNRVIIPGSGTYSGRWLSVSSDRSFPFICTRPAFFTTPPTPSVSTTSPTLSPTTPFGSTCSRGYCYTLHKEPLNLAQASEFCTAQCGTNLVSIHDKTENELVNSLAATGYIQLGVQYNLGVWQWLDGSSWTFNNIGYANRAIGNCLSMSMQDDIVSRGQWVSSDCGQKLPFVCKTNQYVTCTPPTLAPPTCGGTKFLSGEGVVYSPNYPNSYIGVNQPCNYLFTESAGQKARVDFTELTLDAKSSISLYNSIEDTVPFVTFNGLNATLGEYYVSTTNVMKMVFNACQTGCSYGTYFWRVNFYSA